MGSHMWVPKSPKVKDVVYAELAKSASSIKLMDSGGGVPEPFFSTHRFTWDSEHFDRIREFENTGAVTLPDGTVRVADSEGAFLSILRQLTSGCIYAGADGLGSASYELSQSRIDALEDVIESVDGPVLVGIYYKQDVSSLLKRFGKRARVFAGSTPTAERAKVISDFVNDRCDLLLGSPGSMGMGINLQTGSAKTVVWFTHTFDLSQRLQFEARLVRSGQKHNVSIISLCANAGLDNAVLGSLGNKKLNEGILMDALDISTKYNKVRK
jgi:SNF2 family DNA or RNA helicase